MSDARRRSPRSLVRFHVLFDDGEAFDIATVENVSEGGLYVRTSQPLVAGTEVHLSPVGVAEDVIPPLRARVAWSSAQDPCGMGLEFLEASAEAHEALSRARQAFAAARAA